MKKHHTGIVTHRLEKAVSVYTELGYVQIGEVLVDNIQNNKLVFMTKDDDLVELIEPLNEQSTVKNAAEGYHHVCYIVQDLEEVSEIVKTKKLGTVFTDPIVAPAFEYRKIIFAYLKTKMLVEFLESDLRRSP